MGLLGFTDPVYLQLPNKKLFKFLVVCDAMSKYVYAEYLAEVNPTELKRAFKTLFRRRMTYFSILKSDKDKSLGTLKHTFFADRHILLSQRRSKAHMMWLEPVIRTLKKKLIQYLPVIIYHVSFTIYNLPFTIHHSPFTIFQ